MNDRLPRGSSYTGIKAPAQSDGSYYQAQLLSDGRFRIAKNTGGSFGNWNDFLTNADLATGTATVPFSSNAGTLHVDFGKTMSNVPVIILSPVGNNPQTYYFSVVNASTTGFDIKVYVDTVSSGSLGIYWIAATRGI